MSLESLGPEIKNFISRYVQSIGHLEVLLLLFKRKERAWSPSETSDELRSSLFYAEEQLRELASLGLLTKGANGSFKFEPQDSAAERVMPKLADLYQNRRTTLIDAIYARPVDPVQRFADAFKLKKD